MTRIHDYLRAFPLPLVDRPNTLWSPPASWTRGGAFRPYPKNHFFNGVLVLAHGNVASGSVIAR